MSDWTLALTPLAVLPIVVLFRFVGCAAIAGLEPPEKAPEEDIPLPERPPSPPPSEPTPPLPPPPVDTTPPNYRKYILGESPNPGLVKNPGVVPNGADVIAYWRLVDAATNLKAKDEKNFQDGDYQEGHALPAINPTPAAAGSEGRNPAHFVLGQDSLIDSEPSSVKCRYFDGGYVLVPYKPGLYSDQFTIEAWVKTDVLALNFDHTLFDAGGVYAFPPGSGAVERGFRVYANRDRSWQVRLGPGTNDLFAQPPLVPLGARTHVALTVATDGPTGTAKKVTLYVDGKVAGSASISSYAPPDGAPLQIGVENTTNVPTGSPSLRNPVLCRVQEVVLHRKALSKEEIENHVDINR